MKSSNGAHGKRGWLKNGNPPGDFSNAPRCGANAKRTQKPCQAPAMTNGRCQMHGGKSTGPRTEEGLARSRKANWKTGYHSADAKAGRKLLAQVIVVCRTTYRKAGRV